ncbi:hypothetical protein SLA2020_186000 [Shorea laevis]
MNTEQITQHNTTIENLKYHTKKRRERSSLCCRDGTKNLERTVAGDLKKLSMRFRRNALEKGTESWDFLREEGVIVDLKWKRELRRHKTREMDGTELLDLNVRL